MPKFVKSLIEKKRAVKSALALKTAMKGKQGLYTFYSIWFSTIEAYIKGDPSGVKKMAWKIYVIPFVPGGWECTDKGFEGVKARRRCKLINHNLNKTGKISAADKKWLKSELLPAFRADFNSKNLDMDSLIELDDDKIESKIKKAKGDKKFKELVK